MAARKVSRFLHVWAGEGYGNQHKSLKNMVELIGIEPTTS